MDNFNILLSGGFQPEDLVNDGWTDIIGNILLLARKKMAAGEVVEDPAALMQLADFKKMEQVRARVDSVVQDPSTAEALKPYYNQFCKRPCFRRRVSGDLQPSERPPDRHPGQRRRCRITEGDRGQWGRV